MRLIDFALISLIVTLMVSFWIISRFRLPTKARKAPYTDVLLCKKLPPTVLLTRAQLRHYKGWMLTGFSFSEVYLNSRAGSRKFYRLELYWDYRADGWFRYIHNADGTTMEITVYAELAFWDALRLWWLYLRNGRLEDKQKAVPPVQGPG